MSDAPRSPGWYPDPDGADGERWWNGIGWSDSRRPNGASPAPAPDVPPAPTTPPSVPPVIYSAANPAPQFPTETAEHAAVARSRNSPATIGFVSAVVSIFVNFLLVPSIIAVVFGTRGLARARELSDQGEPRSFRITAVLAIVIGAASALWSGTWFVVGLVNS